MKRISLTIMALTAGLFFTVGGQELKASNLPSTQEQNVTDKSSKKEARQQKRQQRHEEWHRDMQEFNQRNKEDETFNALVDSLAGVRGENAMKNMGFVLQADYVTFKNGRRISVTDGTNFISLNGDRAVVQISPDNFNPGLNGMGGITVNGYASGIEINKTKRGDTIFSMTVTGVGINATVEIRMTQGSNRAYATVSPNFNSNTVTLEGQLVPYSQSRVIEGMSL